MSRTPNFPDKKYDVIYADPAWKYPQQTFSKREALETYYDTMSIPDIHALPVLDIAKDNAWLYLWVVDSLLPEGLETVNQWGFIYKKSFIWDKVNMGLGTYNRGQHEQLIMAKRGKPEMPKLEGLPPSVLSVKRGEHSVKPIHFRCMIDQYHPNTEKIELFARPSPLFKGLDDGWDYWGNEV